MVKGFVDEKEMKPLRAVVVHLHNNIDKIPLATDRQRIRRLIRTTRRFTEAEAQVIAQMAGNLAAREFRNGKEATPIQ